MTKATTTTAPTTPTTPTTASRFAEVKMHHATRAKADRLDAMLQAEYPALELVAETDSNDEGDEVLTGWSVNHLPSDRFILESDKLPDLADILDACADEEIDPTEADEADEDEDATGGNVVKEHYRQAYREKSTTGTTCGDWLAEWLVTQTHDVDGLFQVAYFQTVLVLNDVPMTGAWAALPESGQKGWVGRYRMNGRQVLEKIVAVRGTVLFAGPNGLTQMDVPESALSDLRAKHAAYIAKLAKAAKAALNIEEPAAA
jgi:hypothetical protein